MFSFQLNFLNPIASSHGYLKQHAPTNTAHVCCLSTGGCALSTMYAIVSRNNLTLNQN